MIFIIYYSEEKVQEQDIRVCEVDTGNENRCKEVYR